MNIANRIAKMSQKFPDKKSVILGKDHSYYTFFQFENRSNKMANSLTRLGVEKGMRVLLFVKPRLDFSVITFSLFKIGAVPVFIDPGMGMKQLLKAVEDVKPDVLLAERIVHVMRRFKSHFFRTVKINISLPSLLRSCEREDSTFSIEPCLGTDLAAILFTSGGTGKPKGVLYTHHILGVQTDLLQEMFSLDETQVDLPGFPLFALFTLAMGMSSVIPEMNPARPSQCDPIKLVRNINEHKVSFAAGSPAIWERVGEYCVKNNIKLPSVRQVVMFGAPVSFKIHQLFQKVLSNGDTYTPYGATECLPVSLISGSDILQNHLSSILHGGGICIGKAVKNTEIKIIKSSDIPLSKIHELPINKKGEIIVQGDQVTPGYFERNDETNLAKIISDQTWHRMGDLGYLDHNQNVWFLGRKAHLVRSSAGVLFYPTQVEAIFNQHPEIKRSALISLRVDDELVPAVVFERFDHKMKLSRKKLALFSEEISLLKNQFDTSRKIHHFFFHSRFPVDVRHNIKIDRKKLSLWAKEQKVIYLS